MPVRARQMVLLWKRVGYLGVTSQNPNNRMENCDGKIARKWNPMLAPRLSRASLGEQSAHHLGNLAPWGGEGEGGRGQERGRVFPWC